MTASRTKHSFVNLLTSSGARIASLLAMFLVRTVLIRYLGENYVGVEGVITSLMQMLNLSELGISTAIQYRLYKPLSEKDEKSAVVYLSFYRKACLLLGAIILLLGCLLSFFLPLFMTGITLGDSEIRLIFWLYVFQTALSYWAQAYRMAILQADQKNYVVASFSTAGILVGSIAQIFCYVLFRNYIAGLVLLTISQTTALLLTAQYAKRKYPYIVRAGEKEQRLDGQARKDLFKDIYALSLTKLCKTSNRSVPTVVITLLLGAVQAGFYTNYQMIMNAVDSLLGTAFGSITASVGNLNATESDDRKYDAFLKLNHLMFIILCVCASCIWCLTTPFVEFAWGRNYVLSEQIVLAISVYIVISGFLLVIANFKEGSGIFWRGRYRPLIGFVFNIAFSVILVHYFGIIGAIWTAILSRIFTELWFDPLLVHKYTLHRSPKRYFARLILYFTCILGTMLTAGALCDYIALTGIVGLAARFLIALVVSLLIPSLLFRTTKEHLYCLETLRTLLTQIHRKQKAR